MKEQNVKKQKHCGKNMKDGSLSDGHRPEIAFNPLIAKEMVD